MADDSALILKLRREQLRRRLESQRGLREQASELLSRDDIPPAMPRGRADIETLVGREQASELLSRDDIPPAMPGGPADIEALMRREQASLEAIPRGVAARSQASADIEALMRREQASLEAIPRGVAANPRSQATRQAMAENAPAIGATLATMPFGGAGGAVAGAGRLASLPVALGRLLRKPAELAVGAGRAALGGGTAAVAFGDDEKTPIDRFVDSAIEQGIADPIARMTIGLGKFVLRPAGRVLKEEARRVIDFARREGLQIDPGATTEKLIPQMVTNWAKGFIGSRGLARRQQRAIVNHISADPGNANAFFKDVIGAVDATEIAKANTRVSAMLSRAAQSSKSDVLRIAAARGAPGEAAEIIFTDPGALRALRAQLSKQEFAEFLQSHTQNMIQRASKEAPQGVIIDGDALMREITRSRDTLKKYYTTEVVERLENFSLYAKAHGGVPVELADNPVLSRQVALVSAVTAGPTLLMDPITGPGAMAGLVAVSNLITSQIYNPRSLMGKWLTTGLVPSSPMVGAAAEFGANVLLRREVGEATPRKTTKRALGLGSEPPQL